MPDNLIIVRNASGLDPDTLHALSTALGAAPERMAGERPTLLRWQLGNRPTPAAPAAGVCSFG